MPSAFAHVPISSCLSLSVYVRVKVPEGREAEKVRLDVVAIFWEETGVVFGVDGLAVVPH